jgi:hypothetical protein
VLAAVDEAVLQVHAVQAPRAALFDAHAAAGWVEAFAKVTPVPFRVSLPTYGARVGHVPGTGYLVEGEVPLLASGLAPIELVADPGAVSGFVRDLARRAPARLSGIVWFRLPVAGDRRAWSRETWIAAMQGRRPAGMVATVTEPAGIVGIANVVLVNPGPEDARLPGAVALPEGCAPGDGLNGFVLDEASRLRATARGVLRAGHKRIVGWARCGRPAGSDAHAG